MRARARSPWWSWALCALALGAGSAQAQSAETDVQNAERPLISAPPARIMTSDDRVSPRARARELTARATSAYRAGLVADALELFIRAYGIVPAGALLFNIGQCYRQLHHDEQAERAFRGYLRARPDAPERQEIESWIASSARACESGLSPSAAPLPANATPGPRAAGLERSLARAGAAPEQGAADDDDPSITERWWFWTALGVVAAGGGITAAVLLSQDDEPSAGSLGPVRWN